MRVKKGEMEEMRKREKRQSDKETKGVQVDQYVLHKCTHQ